MHSAKEYFGNYLKTEITEGEREVIFSFEQLLNFFQVSDDPNKSPILSSEGKKFSYEFDLLHAQPPPFDTYEDYFINEITPLCNQVAASQFKLTEVPEMLTLIGLIRALTCLKYRLRKDPLKGRIEKKLEELIGHAFRHLHTTFPKYKGYNEAKARPVIIHEAKSLLLLTDFISEAQLDYFKDFLEFKPIRSMIEWKASDASLCFFIRGLENRKWQVHKAYYRNWFYKSGWLCPYNYETSCNSVFEEKWLPSERISKVHKQRIFDFFKSF